VRRLVLLVEHADDDSEEYGDDGHFVEYTGGNVVIWLLRNPIVEAIAASGVRRRLDAELDRYAAESWP
jgi:hypothetical protein